MACIITQYFRPFDGLGYPSDHFEWCVENGLDAHALTEHGNCNSYAHAALYIEDWNKKNKEKPFKFIPGVESYYHPDLEQWRRDKQLAEQAKTDKAAQKKLLKQQERLQTKIIAVTDEADETLDLEMTNALTIENEEESKSTKHFNPVNRRHHLVILPKNQAGLLKIFGAVSYGYLEGFYRFPRIDGPALRRASEGNNVIGISACLHPRSMLITNFGVISIKEVVQQLKNNETIYVLSYDEVEKRPKFEKVIWGDVTRKNAKLLLIKLKNGTSLRLTPDHKVYTKRGWVEAKDLQGSDAILAIHQ